MGNGKRILLVGFLLNVMVVSLLTGSVGASPRVYTGHVVGIEFSILQVRGEDGRVSTFWCGYKTFLNSSPRSSATG